MEGTNLMEAKRVLVIEDDAPLRQLITQLIEQRHGAVIPVDSGAAAKRILKEQHERYDLVFLDLILPEVTGWEILDILKAKPELKDTPIIIFTGASLSAEEREKMLQRAAAIMEKNDFTLKAFFALLDRWL